MPKPAPIATFQKLMTALLSERRACLDRLKEIDGMFARYGLALGGVPARPGGSPTTAQAARLANLAKARAARSAKAAARKAGTPAAAPEAAGPRRVQRHYSAAARRAMAEASKRRWAAYHAEQAQRAKAAAGA